MSRFRANFFHGVTAKHDPRFKNKIHHEKLDFPANVTASLEMSGINIFSFEQWVKAEVEKYTKDDLVPGMVQGFLEGKVVKSQELGKMLQPFLNDHTTDFVSRLWDLLVDAKDNGTGIPSLFIEQSRKELEEREKQFNAIREKAQQMSASSESSDYDSDSVSIPNVQKSNEIDETNDDIQSQKIPVYSNNNDNDNNNEIQTNEMVNKNAQSGDSDDAESSSKSSYSGSDSESSSSRSSYSSSSDSYDHKRRRHSRNRHHKHHRRRPHHHHRRRHHKYRRHH